MQLHAFCIDLTSKYAPNRRPKDARIVFDVVSFFVQSNRGGLPIPQKTAKKNSELSTLIGASWTFHRPSIGMFGSLPGSISLPIFCLNTLGTLMHTRSSENASLPKNGFPMIHRQFTFYFLDILTMFNPRIHHQSIKKTSTISRLYQQQVSVLHPNTKSCLMVR